MTIGEHLIELRSRLIKAIAIFAICFIVALIFQEELMSVLTYPHEQVVKEIKINEPGFEMPLEPIKYQETFIAFIKMAFVSAIFVGSPMIAYQIWAFVAAGLYLKERKWVYVFAPFSLILFIGGCMFGYFVLIRYGLLFLADYAPEFREKITLSPSLSMYMSLVLTLTVVAGVIFELPLIMLFLSKIGVVPPRAWIKFARYMIVGIFLLAALLTPPDVVTQLLMAGPLLVLYAFGVLLAKLAAPKKTA